jgi:hypothetical protein
VAPEASTSTPSALPGELTDVPDTGHRRSAAIAGGIVGVLAAIAAAVFWWRQRQQIPPTRKELLADRARAASLALATKKEQVATSAAPLVRTGRRVSAAAAERAAVQARVAAERAAVQARGAAQQAAAVAAAARTVRLQRVQRDVAVEPRPDAGSKTGGWHRRDAVMSALQVFGGFGAGYAVGARAGRAGAQRLEETGVSEQGGQLPRIAGRVQTRVTDTVRAANAQLSQRGSAVAGRVRRSSAGDDGRTPSSLDGSGTSA